MTVTVEGGDLVIRLPLNTVNPPVSKGEKTLVVASSRGNKSTNVKVKDRNVIVGVNAYIYRNADGT